MDYYSKWLKVLFDINFYNEVCIIQFEEKSY